MLPRVERAARVQQHPPQLIPQVVKGRSEGERRVILVDRLRQRPGLVVGVAQRGVLVRELGGHMGRQPLTRLASHLGRPPERHVRLGLAPQLVQHDGPMDERLDVAGIQRQRPVELGEGLLLLADERVRQAQQVMRVGERPPAGDDFLQQVDGAVVVLELEALAGLGHEVLRTDVHGPPRTTARSVGSPPRCRS